MTKYDFVFLKEEVAGMYSNNEVIINLNAHENLEDLFSTITHESLHAAIDKVYKDWSPKATKKEHWAINRILWISEYV